MMPWNKLLQNLRAEIADAERRTSSYAQAVSTLVASGADSTDAERMLFHELDSLTFLRTRLGTLQTMQWEFSPNQTAA